MKAALNRFIIGAVIIGLSLSTVPASAQMSPAQLKAQKDQAAREAAARARAEQQRAAALARAGAAAKARAEQEAKAKRAAIASERRYWSKKNKPEAPTIEINSSDSEAVHALVSSGSNDKNFNVALSKSGVFPTRQIDYDIWHPDNEDEWKEIGKFAVLKLTVSTNDESELPLKSVYVIKGDNRIEGRKIYTLNEKKDEFPIEKGFPLYFRVTYFYIIPTNSIKNNEEIFADFSQNRQGFKIGSAGYIPSFSIYSNNDFESLDLFQKNKYKFTIVMKREYPDFADKF